MKHITTWSPDTCGCELHYEWDDTLPEGQRVHTPVEEFIDSSGNVRRSKKCEHHKLLATKEDHHTKILTENQGKNKVLASLMEAEPTLVETFTDKDGSVQKRFKPGSEPAWEFDATRKLVVTIPAGKKLLTNRVTQLKTMFADKKTNNEIGIDVDIR